MSRWARANLRRGTLDGQRILQADSYAELWRPQVTIGDEPGKKPPALAGFWVPIVATPW